MRCRPNAKRFSFLVALIAAIGVNAANAQESLTEIPVEHFHSDGDVAQVAANAYAFAPLQDGAENSDTPDVSQPGQASASVQPEGSNAAEFDSLETGSGTSSGGSDSAVSPYSGAPYGNLPDSPSTASKPGTSAKERREAATAAMKGAYKGVFYANDFSYLDDPYYDGPYFPCDNLKGLLGGRLDIGGEARTRYHSERNIRGRAPGLRGAGPSGLGLTNNDDDFFLTRLRLFANYRVNETFRIYGEYLYADSAGEQFAPRPTEENRELQNLFLDTKLTDNLVLRVGRQELLYGDQRLIAPLDWANTRRTFEGARGLYSGENWDIDGFFVHPVDRSFENVTKIDDADEDQDFYGVYATRKGLDIGLVDMYYLGFNNQTVNFNYHTIGGRVSGATEAGYLYTYEGGVQFGNNSPGLGDHGASFYTSGWGKQLNLGDWKPTVWLWYDYASGEQDFNQASRGDDGFDHLFPLAHKYLGFMDLFGRRNIQDYNMQFITPLASTNVELLLWYHYFRLDQQTTPYDVVMQPYNTNTRAASKDLGHEIDVLFNINLNPRNNVLIGYSHFNAGDYYERTPGTPSNDADFFYTQFQTRF